MRDEKPEILQRGDMRGPFLPALQLLGETALLPVPTLPVLAAGDSCHHRWLVWFFLLITLQALGPQRPSYSPDVSIVQCLIHDSPYYVR